MAIFANYNFYVGTYGGSAIALADYDFLANKASAFLDMVTFGGASTTITADEDEALIEKIQQAACAIAEQYQRNDEDGAVVQSERVGAHSVTYKVDGETQEKKLNSIARVYLANTGLLYRGIS